MKKSAPSPKTAASHLAKGNLHGELLDKLIDEYICIIHNLQSLTRLDEQSIVQVVRKKLEKAEKDRCRLPFDISAETDAIVGFTIKRNRHPDTGPKLWEENGLLGCHEKANMDQALEIQELANSKTLEVEGHASKYINYLNISSTATLASWLW